MKLIALLASLFFSGTVLAQSPSPTPPDQRGLGIQKADPTSNAQTASQSREAKPELVLQTGYNNIFGATRLVFSPDGKLLATGTFRSNTIKLWETATNRKLRDLSSSGQTASGLAPSIAFSRDGRLLAASAADNSVKVWDVNSGREVQTLTGPQGTVTAAIGVFFIGFASDNRIVTASDVARVWDLTSGRELRTLDTGGPNAAGMMGGDGGVTISADGTQLVFVSDDSDVQVRVIDLSSGREVRQGKLSGDRVDSVQLVFAPGGQLLAAGVVDKRLKLWDVSAKKEQTLAQTAKDYSLVKFSRDGRLLAFSENYLVKVWDTATGRELTQLKVPNSGVFTAQADAFVAFSEDGKRIATGGFDTDTIVWETETGKRLSNLTGRTNMAYNVAFSADGTQLSSGGRTRWDLRTGRGLRTAPATPDKTYPVASPDGRLLAVMNPNKTVVSIVESPTGRELQTLTPTGETGVVQKLRFSADGTMLAVVYSSVQTVGNQQQVTVTTTSFARGSQVKLWDMKTGRELRSLAAGELPSEAEFSADGRMLATIGSMGQTSLWDVQSGSKLRDVTSSPMSTLITTPPVVKPGQMPQMPDMAAVAAMMNNVWGTMAAGTMGRTVTSLAFSPDGRTLLTGGVESKTNIDFTAMMGGAMSGKRPKPSKGSKTQDSQDIMKDLRVEAIGQVQIWDVASGREIGNLKGHGRAVSKLALSRDGKLLATGSTDNTIKIWDLGAKRELVTLAGHNANMESLDFSPDGGLLASAGEDGSTFLWDAKTGEHLLTLISLDDGGEWMVVTPQGLFDGTPVSWNQILWRYNQETFNVAPIEWFFNEFYYPGLLSDVFAGKRPKVAEDVSKKDRRQPVVKLSLPAQAGQQTPDAAVGSRTIKVRIDVTDAPADKDNPQGTGARDVRLFRNGSLVKVWHGDVLKGQPSVSLEEEITVTAGPNWLVAYGFNRDNVKSKDAPLVFTGAESLKRKGTAYVIAVGVNEYENPQYNLKYATADARSFGDEVRRRQMQVGEFEKVEVAQLLDKDATKANILAAIKRLAGDPGPPSLKAGPFDALKRVQPEDTVIIYYAGHGTAQAQRFYLIPHDLGYMGDRTKLTEDGLKTMLTHSISDLELEAAVEGLDSGHLLLIIDACNSGQALEAEEKRRGPMNSKGLAQLAYEKGMYILTAAQSFQAALEAAQLGHGYLTYALVEEGLKTPVADTEPKDGVLIAREWLNFATERVPQMQQEKMTQGRGLGLEIAFTEGETNIADPQKRSVQRPRVFYRRELETNPLVIAKP
ncbi:MAG: caspase family protein [Acidobacteria bacterium]|nr:caspase family protein [Acidobacteriota bacterium]MCA1627533.1 caspase family protein [Acidobacteriota bacterium]